MNKAYNAELGAARLEVVCFTFCKRSLQSRPCSTSPVATHTASTYACTCYPPHQPTTLATHIHYTCRYTCTHTHTHNSEGRHAQLVQLLPAQHCTPAPTSTGMWFFWMTLVLICFYANRPFQRLQVRSRHGQFTSLPGLYLLNAGTLLLLQCKVQAC